MHRQSRSKSPRGWLRFVPFAVFAAAFAIACGGSDSDSPGAASQGGSAPPVSAAVPEDAGKAELRQISADAQRCLDLVRAESYVAAVDPCQRAVESGASADVEEALATAKAAVAEEGTAAALRAVASGLEGRSMVDSLKESAANAMGEATELEAEAAGLEAKAGALEAEADALQDAAGALQGYGRD